MVRAPKNDGQSRYGKDTGDAAIQTRAVGRGPVSRRGGVHAVRYLRRLPNALYWRQLRSPVLSPDLSRGLYDGRPGTRSAGGASPGCPSASGPSGGDGRTCDTTSRGEHPRDAPTGGRPGAAPSGCGRRGDLGASRFGRCVTTPARQRGQPAQPDPLS